MATSNKLFVYGTLRRGFTLHSLLHKSGARFAKKGRIRAKLFDLGEYPGVLPSRKRTDFVEGEVYRLTSPSTQLSILDEVEEFDPKRPRASLFRRRLVEVHLQNGKKETAWAYFYNRDTRKARLLPHGDYSLASKHAAASDVRA
jgi:pyruvate carboxylase